MHKFALPVSRRLQCAAGAEPVELVCAPCVSCGLRSSRPGATHYKRSTRRNMAEEAQGADMNRTSLCCEVNSD